MNQETPEKWRSGLSRECNDHTVTTHTPVFVPYQWALPSFYLFLWRIYYSVHIPFMWISHRKPRLCTINYTTHNQFLPSQTYAFSCHTYLAVSHSHVRICWYTNNIPSAKCRYSYDLPLYQTVYLQWFTNYCHSAGTSSTFLRGHFVTILRFRRILL
jgi:hypothetical protein